MSSDPYTTGPITIPASAAPLLRESAAALKALADHAGDDDRDADDDDTAVTISIPGSDLPPVETTVGKMLIDADAQRIVRAAVQGALGPVNDDAEDLPPRPDPAVRFHAPRMERDFRKAPDLEAVSVYVLGLHGMAFPDLIEYQPSICWLWKRDGGKKWSDTAICSTELHFHTGADVRIWLSAEHVSAYELTHGQVEALIFHALSHVAVARDKEGFPTGLVKRAHDVEAFGEEIERFGLWQAELVASREGRQLRLLGVDL